MPRPDRPTLPPPMEPRGSIAKPDVPRPRAKLPSYRDVGDSPPVDRDEHLLKVMREMEQRIANKIADVRLEAVEEAQRSVRPSPKSEPPKATHWFSTIPAILIAAAGLVTAIAALKKEPDTTKDEQSYKTLSEALSRKDAADAARAKVEDDRWKFSIGLFKRIPGITILEAPGQEPIEPIDILPPPRLSKPPPAPTIQVRAPLPAPAPSVAPVKLPTAEKIYGEKKL